MVLYTNITVKNDMNLKGHLYLLIKDMISFITKKNKIFEKRRSLSVFGCIKYILM